MRLIQNELQKWDVYTLCYIVRLEMYFIYLFVCLFLINNIINIK